MGFWSLTHLSVRNPGPVLGGVCVCIRVMLLVLLQPRKQSAVSLCCSLLISVLQSCCGALDAVQMCSERGVVGCWTGSSPSWEDALGHRSVRGIFHELTGETLAAFCGLVPSCVGRGMTWWNSREMGRNRGRRGNGAINSSQKGQNIRCAKNMQPHCWYYFTAVALSYFKMMNGRGGSTDLLGEIRWPKACWGSRENSGDGERLHREVSPGSVLGLRHPWEDSPVCLGCDFSSGGRPGFWGAELMSFCWGNMQRVQGHTVHGGAHHPASVGCCELFGRHLPRACKFKMEACSVQGLSV